MIEFQKAQKNDSVKNPLSTIKPANKRKKAEFLMENIRIRAHERISKDMDASMSD